MLALVAIALRATLNSVILAGGTTTSKPTQDLFDSVKFIDT